MSKRSSTSMSSCFSNSTSETPMKYKRRREEEPESPNTYKMFGPGKTDEISQYGFAMQKMLRIMEKSYSQSLLTMNEKMKEYSRAAEDIVKSQFRKFVEEQNKNNLKLKNCSLEGTDVVSEDLKGPLGIVKTQENQFRFLSIQMENSFQKAPMSEISRSCSALDELMNSYLKDIETLKEQFQKDIDKMEGVVNLELKSLQDRILNETKQIEKENLKKSLKDFPLLL